MSKKTVTIETNSELINEKSLQRLIDHFENLHTGTSPELPDESHRQITNKMISEVIENHGLKENSKVLDVGCGQGYALDFFKEKGMDVTGITIDETDLKLCRDHGHNVFKMDQSFLEFDDKSFDLVWARHVLEHSTIPYHTIEEYKRVLKDDGILYVEVPLPEQFTKQEANSFHPSVFPLSVWKETFIKKNLDCISVLMPELEYKIEDKAYTEKYASFIMTQKVKENPETENKKIVLALSKGENFGWGVCSKYLRQEVSKLYPDTVNWDPETDGDEEKTVAGKVVHALTGLEFNSITKMRGSENYGYTFFENELTDESVTNSKNYDLVLGGSTWCKERMEEKGIHNTDVLIQGIDPIKFYPIEEEKDDNLFVLFSGGKFELRKGQDLVLKAVKILQEKYNDIILVNAWFNMWPESMFLMKQSKHIEFDVQGESWQQVMNHIYELNDMDKSRIFTYDIIPNDKLRELYSKTDLGIFPNRCEGGTNLVLMEYMACAKPVVATYATGHTDILTNDNSFMMTNNGNLELTLDGKPWAKWAEPSLDELIEYIEYAYLNRDRIRKIGKKAGEDLKKYTWEQSARQLLSIINK